MSNAADRPLNVPTPLLSSLSIRDIVLVESLDLDFGAGLTVLTGETGAGKSIILDALGLATGQRADAGLVRSSAKAAISTAIFCPPPGHAVWACLTERGLNADPSEDLVLRRQVGADGRSKAYVNDQSVSVGVLRDLGTLLLEVHGQHETVGLLDPRTHGALLDSYGQLGGLVETCRRAFADWRAARKAAETLRQQAAASAAEADELSARLDELDRLDAKPGEELALAGERALLGASEAALEDLKEARDSIGGDQLSQRLAKAFRALDHARTRARQAGAEEGHPVLSRLNHAAEALDRTLVEAEEALAAIDGAAEALDVEPGKLDRVEERLFALRGLARKLNVLSDDLPKERARIAGLLRLIEDSDAALKAADQAVAEARRACVSAAAALTAARAEAGARLAAAVMAELGPLKLDKARFRVAFEALPEERWTGEGAERIAFEVMTNPGAPWGGLAVIASGGELARFALALKAALAGQAGAGGSAPVMIFDEVDQGVGGAVADAVGMRLRRLSDAAQVLVVTHSPQVAARGHAHWKVTKSETEAGMRTRVETLSEADRETELARMLSGAEVTDAARAAARALIGA